MPRDVLAAMQEAIARAARDPWRTYPQMFSRREMDRAERIRDAALPGLREAVEGLRDPMTWPEPERYRLPYEVAARNEAIDDLLALLGGGEGERCSDCDGRGHYTGWPHTTCPTCSGSGEARDA